MNPVLNFLPAAAMLLSIGISVTIIKTENKFGRLKFFAFLVIIGVGTNLLTRMVVPTFDPSGDLGAYIQTLFTISTIISGIAGFIVGYLIVCRNNDMGKAKNFAYVAMIPFALFYFLFARPKKINTKQSETAHID